MVGQVADILIMWEGDCKGEGVIALPRCSTCGSCPLAVMVSKERGEEKKMREGRGEVTNGPRCYKMWQNELHSKSFVGEICKTEKWARDSLPGHESAQHCRSLAICPPIVAYMP